MFRTSVSTYINSNLNEHHLSAKELAARAQIPESTLSNYKTGKIENPSDEQLFRIAAVFGDGPEVIRLLRLESEESAQKEARLKAEAKDRALIEQVAAIIREGSVKLLAEHSAGMAAQQSEIIAHTDKRIEEERQRFKERTAEVLRQCNEEILRAKENCAREIALHKEFYEQRAHIIEAQYEARLAESREHLAQLIAAEHEHSNELRERYGSSREYLKSSIRNLTGACVILMMTTFFFGAYALFAYTTFDMADPSRGFHRGSYSIGPVVFVLSMILVATAISRLVILFVRRPKNKSY